MGERVHAGKLIYNVFETQWLTQLGQGPAARVPQNRFFLVRVSVVNSGGAEVLVPTMQLVDEGGQTHPELSNGEEVPQWIGFLRHAQPAENLQGNVIFDVPPRRYKLRVMDEKEEREALIDIPLSFDSEMPPPAAQ